MWLYGDFFGYFPWIVIDACDPLGCFRGLSWGSPIHSSPLWQVKSAPSPLTYQAYTWSLRSLCTFVCSLLVVCFPLRWSKRTFTNQQAKMSKNKTKQTNRQTDKSKRKKASKAGLQKCSDTRAYLYAYTIHPYTLSLSRSVFVWLSVCPRLFSPPCSRYPAPLTHKHKHARTRARTLYTHTPGAGTQTRERARTHTHTQGLALSLSLSLSHTHTHTNLPWLTLSNTLTWFCPFLLHTTPERLAGLVIRHQLQAR